MMAPGAPVVHLLWTAKVGCPGVHRRVDGMARRVPRVPRSTPSENEAHRGHSRPRRLQGGGYSNILYRCGVGYELSVFVVNA